MDWSDAALEANYRQMVQLYGMPNSILEWKGQARRRRLDEGKAETKIWPMEECYG